MVVTPRRKVTSKDVAAVAGVSRTTVSFVLNNTLDTRISDETRERVLEVAARLGYVPNAKARSLVTGKTHTLALYVRQHSLISVDWFCAKLLEALSLAVNEGGYRLLIESYDGTSTVSMVDLANARELDGVVVLDPHHDDRSTEALRGMGLPMVIVGGATKTDDITVGADDRWSAPALIGHLRERGYTDLGYVHYGPVEGESNPYRGVAMMEEAERQIPDGTARILAGARFTSESGYEAVRRLIRDGPMPRVLMMGNDTVAIGGIAALIEAGYSIPGDIAVTGFDDTPAARFLYPPLTTVRQPVAEIARACAALLLAQVQGQPLDGIPRNFEPELVVRSST